MSFAPSLDREGGPATASGVDAGESSRRWIVRLVVAVILLLLVEGALRKWVAPTQGRLLFFIRDPFVLGAYVLALAGGWWPRPSPILVAGLLFAALGALLAVAQLASPAAGASAGMQALFAVYGWRNYFLYLPLPFLMAATFTRRDLMFTAKLLFLAAIPIAMLTVAQFAAPPGSWLNAGFSDNPMFQFRGGLYQGDGRVRPAGSFSSSNGLRMYAAGTAAIALGLWLLPAQRRHVPWWLLVAGTAGVFGCLAFGGSRGAVLNIAIVGLAAVFSGLFVKASATTIRAIALPPLIAVLGFALWPVLFPEGHQAFMGRWDAAAAHEAKTGGILGRAFGVLLLFTRLLEPTPLLGYGIGLGGNASLVLGLDLDIVDRGLGEVDWGRHIIDLGVLLGPAYILFRIVLVAWLFIQAFGALRRNSDPLAMVILAFAGIELLQGQITGQGSVHGFAWVFAGLALAAVSTGGARTAAATAAAVPTPRFPNLLR